MSEAPKPVGRPSDYTQELAAEIFARMAEGQSVRKICSDETMPSSSTIFLWVQKHKEFSDNYDLAARDRAYGIAEDTIEIADDGRNDWMERQSTAEKGAGVNTGWVLNGEHVQRSRLRVDARKWFASRLDPKRWGDKITNEHSGPGGGDINLTHKVEITIKDPANVDPKA